MVVECDEVVKSGVMVVLKVCNIGVIVEVVWVYDGWLGVMYLYLVQVIGFMVWQVFKSFVFMVYVGCLFLVCCKGVWYYFMLVEVCDVGVMVFVEVEQ